MILEKITIDAPAKINLTLDVVGKRADGYHEVKSVMQSVGLFDKIALSLDDSGKITIKNSFSFLPVNEKNIAYAAAKAFFEYTKIRCGGLLIEIEKNIPVAAGLGGGSADGAAVLRGLNILYNTNLSAEKLKALARPLGADVPFCVEGKTFLATGAGETLKRLKDMPKAWTLLVKPDFSLSTAEVFKKVSLKSIRLRPDTQGMIQAIDRADLSGIAHRLYNVLEDFILPECNEIALIKDRLLELGALGAVMSGSGPTVFGVFSDEEAARLALRGFGGRYFKAAAEIF